MRVAVEDAFRKADILQQTDRERAPPLFRDPLMDDSPLGQDIENRVARVERRLGILKDHLEIAAVLLKRLFPKGQHIDAVQQDLAVLGPVEPENRAGEGGFAATGLADDAEGFALAERQINAVHRTDPSDSPRENTLFDREPAPQVLDFKERL